MSARLTLPRMFLALVMALAGLVSLPVGTAQAAPTLSSPTDLPSSYPYQPELEEAPVNGSDASIARGSIPFHDIAPQLNDWMDESDIISTQVVGRSTRGRDVHLVTITAPESEAETAQQERWKAQVKHDAAAAAKDEELQAGYKQPIWFNNNIHGNEWEGTDSSLQYIEHLLENENKAQVKELLKKFRIHITLSNNPDGRVAGTRETALGFDPNRDFVTNTLPETQLIRDLTSSIQPLFFTDIHGYTNVLQIEPTGPPHGENYDYDLFIPHAYASALRIQDDVVAADIPGNTYYDKARNTATTAKTGLIKIPYRDTPSGWDDWPPVFTAQYVAYQGAVSTTAELPLGRSSNATTHKANGLVNQKVGLQVIDSTMDYVLENGDDLLDNQIEIFRRGAAGEPLKQIPANPDPSAYPGPDQWAAEWGPEDVTGAEFPRAYVLPAGPGQRSATDTAYLVDYLISHDVQVRRASADFTAGGTKYRKGSYVVDMHQPLRGLANALLAAGSDISQRVTSMYDISAWSHGYLWGADVDRIGSTDDPALDVTSEPITRAAATGAVPSEAGSYLSFELRGVDTFRGLNALLGEGVAVSSVPGGKAVLGNDAKSLAAATAVAKEYGVAFTATNGSELAEEGVKALKRLRVGYTGLASDDRTSLRLMGFAEDQLVPVTAATIASGAVDLTTIDVLWLGGTLTTSGAGTIAMQAYIDAGKGFVGRGSAASTFANTWLGAGATAVSGNGNGNGIVKLSTEKDGVLGPVDTKWGFVSPATSFAVSGVGTGKVEQTYAAVEEQEYAGQGTLLSGHWRRTSATNGPDHAVGRASVYSAEKASSGAKGLVFGTSVVYRTHPRGHFTEILTGLYWAGAGAAEGLEAPTATTTELELSAPSQTYGAAPATATVKVLAAESVASRAGTIALVDGEEVVATGSVNRFGNGTITLPADLVAGTYDLSARFTPTPGTALGTSESAPVAFEVEPAESTTTLELSSQSQVAGTTSPVTATATVGVPTGLPAAKGTVEVLIDGDEVGGDELSDGSVQVTLPGDLAVGEHEVTARFVPAAGSSYLGSTSAASTLTVTAAPAPRVRSTSTIKVAKSTITTKQKAKVTLTVKASGAVPTGTITIVSKGKRLKTVQLSASHKGTRVVNLPKLKAGTYVLKMTYSGNASVLGSSDTTKLKVKKK